MKNIDLTKLSRDYINNPLITNKKRNENEKPCKEDLVYLYIDLNMSAQECSEFFKISVDKTNKLIRKLGIKKDIRAINEVKSRRTKECLINKYGVDNPGLVPEFQQKQIKTLEERYGVKVPLKNKELLEKRDKTNISKYGGRSSMCDEEVREKSKKTILERYGVDNPTKNKSIYDKVRKTNLERYGCEIVAQNKDIKKKISIALSSKKSQNKSKQTCLNKYGVEYITQIGYSKETYDIITNKDKLKLFILSQKNRTTKNLTELLNINRANFNVIIHKFGLDEYIDWTITCAEVEINLLFNNIFVKTKQVILPKEIDLYNADTKIGIEFNGDYWHSDKYKDKYYHINKTNLAKEKDVFLFHLWEYEWEQDKEYWYEYIRMLLNKEIPIIEGDYILQDISKEPDYWFNDYDLIETIEPQICSTGKFTYFDCGYNKYRKKSIHI